MNLNDFAKVAQAKVNNGFVYFPVYRPSKSQNKVIWRCFYSPVDDNVFHDTS